MGDEESVSSALFQVQRCAAVSCSCSESSVSPFSHQTVEPPLSPTLSPTPASVPELEPGPGSSPCPGDGVPVTNSTECYFCGQRVYVLERISAEGKFFHRSCFSCHQCGITLRLGGYTFDEDTGEGRARQDLHRVPRVFS